MSAPTVSKVINDRADVAAETRARVFVALEEADALTHLGDTHHLIGGHDAARTAWQQALEILTDVDGPNADHIRARLDRLEDADDRIGHL